MTELTIRWADAAELETTADFLVAAIRLDDSYISHGEIQTGLSLDGRTWAPDLADKMRKDLAEDDPHRSVVVAFEGDRLVAAGIVLKCFDARASYVVIDDIAVSPQARSGGTGRAVVDFIETQAREWGADWVFLESGLDNHGAHRFFERMGYAPRSKVFGKHL